MGAMIRRIWSPLVLTGLALLIGALPAAAVNYVSFGGGFYITLPDDWTQVDHNLVNAYLTRNKARATSLQYEAAFAPRASEPFFAGDYFFLSVDTIGELTGKRLDSVLAEMQSVFGAWIKYAPGGNTATELKANSPVYDPDRGTVTVVNDVSHPGQSPRKNLLIMKFYERGIASFYFYSPDSLFEQSKNTFLKIVESFSTENVEAALPREQLKVADVSQRKTEAPASEGRPEGGSTVIWLGVAVVMVMALVTLMRRRRRNPRDQASR
jgi:hypothetical protein